MSRVLVISNDVVGKQMAGPGIRTWELAKLLSQDHNVTLLTPFRTELEHSRITIDVATRDSVRRLADCHDVMIGQGQVLSRYPLLLHHPIVKVIDLYDPSPIGFLEISSAGNLQAKINTHHSLVRDHYAYLRAGDLFLCASERQWDFWLGMLCAAGRVNPAVYEDDRMLQKLMIVAPYGVPAQPPMHRRRVLKGVWPGISQDDVVLLWGGGIWEWFDPKAAVEAMDRVRRKRKDVKLFFMGVKRPNASVTTSIAADETIARAEQLGLLDKWVFFNSWAPYEDRENFLLEADLGLNVHKYNLETRFSFRTRMMDYIWAGLPVITTEGDPLSELVKEKSLGMTVPCGNVEVLAEAIIQAADAQGTRQLWAKNCRETAANFSWDQVFEPVVAWCRAPSPARDKEYAKSWDSLCESPRSHVAPSFSYYLGRAAHYYRAAGVTGLVGQTFRWWRRR